MSHEMPDNRRPEPEAPATPPSSPWRRGFLLGCVAGVVFEAITLVFRFGFQLRSNVATQSTVGVLTRGIRIHHGYLGLLFLLFVLIIVRINQPNPFFQYTRSQTQPRWTVPLLALGWGLVLSDLAHHFLILWPITGDPQFDFTYPSSNPNAPEH